MKITAKLTNWSHLKAYNSFVGTVTNDVGNKNRKQDWEKFRDEEYIYTSSIKTISDDGRYVTTQNSVYELDPPFVFSKSQTG